MKKKISFIDLGEDGKMVWIELLFVSDDLQPQDIANVTFTNLRPST